jgi:hypothetical protein
MSDSHSEGIQGTPPHISAHGIQSGNGHGASHHQEECPFSGSEIAHFQREDRYAGGAVVVLMGSIFSIGVVLYTIVLISVL